MTERQANFQQGLRVLDNSILAF